MIQREHHNEIFTHATSVAAAAFRAAGMSTPVAINSPGTAWDCMDQLDAAAKKMRYHGKRDIATVLVQAASVCGTAGRACAPATAPNAYVNSDDYWKEVTMPL